MVSTGLLLPLRLLSTKALQVSFEETRETIYRIRSEKAEGSSDAVLTE